MTCAWGRRWSAVVVVWGTALTAGAQGQGQPIEEVVVTAQHRDQLEQQLPISMSTLDGEALTDFGIKRPEDLAAQTPGLLARPSDGGESPIFTMRGVGLDDFAPNQNPKVGVYIDEVFMPFHPMTTFQMFDLKRTEVLKGPQGTLYGRNSTGGAINFISAPPTDHFESSLRAEGRWYQDGELEGAVSGPVGDTLSLRLAGTGRRRFDGFYKDRTTGDDIGLLKQGALRFTTDWHPTSDFSLVTRVHAGTTASDQSPFEHVARLDPTDPTKLCAQTQRGERDEAHCVDLLGYSDPDHNHRTVDAGGHFLTPILNAQAQGVSFIANWDVPRVRLTSVSGYEHYKRFSREDFSGNPREYGETFFGDKISSFSQELRVSSDPSWPVDWIAGVFWSRDGVNSDDGFYAKDLQADPSFGFPNPGDFEVDIYQATQVKGAFLHTEIPLSPAWRLTAGLRYSDEHKDYHTGTFVDDSLGRRFPANFGSRIFASDPFAAGPFSPAVGDPIAAGRKSDKDLSPTIGLAWSPTKTWMSYIKYSKGFTSGGVQGSFATAPEAIGVFDKEQLHAYEAGFKSTLSDSLQLNAAYYYYIWKDVQLFLNQKDPQTSLINNLLDNAGNAVIRGLEIDAKWLPVAGLELSFGGSYLHTKIAKSNALQSDQVTPIQGNELSSAPQFTTNGRIRYSVPLSETYSAWIQFDGSWRDAIYFSTENSKFFHDGPQDVWNARMALVSAPGGWTASLFALNVFDKLYKDQIIDQGLLGFGSYKYGDPRVIGLSFEKKWQ